MAEVIDPVLRRRWEAIIKAREKQQQEPDKELDSIEAELWSFAKEKRNYPEGTPDPRIPWWHEESWTNFFKALKEPIRSTSSTAEDGKGSGEEGAAFPTA